MTEYAETHHQEKNLKYKDQIFWETRTIGGKDGMGSIAIFHNGKGYCVDVVVPENCVFAMGDNRAQSTDCRCFGCIPLEKIESKVWIRVWPLDKFGKIDK